MDQRPDTSARRPRSSSELETIRRTTRAIRAVSQQLAQGADAAELYQEICTHLASSGLFQAAWVVLLDEAGKPVQAAHGPPSEAFEALEADLLRGDFAPCAEAALRQADGAPQAACAVCDRCPLAGSDPPARTLTVRLGVDGAALGVLAAYLSLEVAQDQWMLALVEEIGAALSFAIYAQRLRQAQQDSQVELRLARRIMMGSRAVLFRWRNAEAWPVEFVSNNVEEVLGYTAAELTAGQPPYAELVHPDDLARVSEEVAKHSSDPRATDFVHEPYRMVHQYDAPRWVEDRTRIVRDAEGRVTHYEGIVLDVSDRMEAEARLNDMAKMLAQFKQVIDQANAGVAIVELTGAIIYVNDYFAAAHGYGADELIGQSLALFHDERQLEQVERINAQLQQTGSYENRTVWHVRRDGSAFPMMMSAVLIEDAQGQPELMAAAAVDITVQQELEREREQLLRVTAARVKELTCIFGVTRAAQRAHTLSDVFHDVAALIPPGWRYPDITRAKVCFDGEEYCVGPFAETPWHQVEDIMVRGAVRGSIEVYYLEERPSLAEGPFSTEERNLLRGIADTVAEVIRRKEAEEELQRSEARYRALFESSRDALMILTPPAWRFISANQATLQLFAAPDEKTFCSHRPWDLSPELQPDGRPSTDQAKGMIETAMKKGSHFFEWTHRRTTGEDFPATVLLTRFQHGGEPIIQATVRDVTELKRAEQALEMHGKQLEAQVERRTQDLQLAYEELRREMRLAEQARETTRQAHDEIDRVFQTAGGGMRVVDGDFTVVKANHAFAELSGHPLDEIIGSKCYETFAGPQCGTPSCTLVRVEQGDVVRDLQVPKVAGGGQEMLCEIRATPLFDADGCFASMVEDFRDMTEHNRLRSIAEAVSLADNIRHAFSGIRHELGNPVNNMKATLTVLQRQLEQLSQAEVSEQLSWILTEIGRIEFLLQSLKSFNMFETVAPERVEVIPFIDQFMPLVQDDLAARGIELRVRPPVDGVTVTVDPRALQQVLLNLVGNGADAVEDRKGPVIEIGVGRTGRWAQIAIEDNGPGIAKHQLASVAKPFYTTKKNGTGLGLAIVHKLVAKMGGSVEIVCEPDRGTTVQLRLPLALKEEARDEADPAHRR